jgi:carbonic anhydrase/acetyltransferase-like protein (isoleucine patch superfamily)
MPDIPLGRAEVSAGVGPLYTFEGTSPKIAADAWIAPSAAIIGDVTIGAQSGIWFHCVLRGDTNFIRIGARSNIQDGTVIHVNAGREATIIGDEVTVGHSALIHACTLENRAFVGMAATVLDGAAGALLTPGKRIGRNELWSGSPAKLWRVMDAEERAKFDRTAVHYVELGQRYLKGLRTTG